MKKIFSILAATLLGVCMLGGCGNAADGKTEDLEELERSSAISLASEQIAPIDYTTDEGVYVRVVRSYRVKATSYDEDGEEVDESLQKFDFTVDWQVPHTQSVSDYVIVENVTEREITLGLIRAFEGPIVLTAASRFDSSVKKTMPCYFAQRVNGILFTYSKALPDWTKNSDPQYHGYLYLHEEMRTMQSGETATLHMSPLKYHGATGGQKGSWLLRALTTGSATFDGVGVMNGVKKYTCSARYSGEFLSKLMTGSEYAISSDWTTLYSYDYYNFNSHTVGSTEYSQWGLLTALAKDGSGNGAVQYYLGTAAYGGSCQGPAEQRFLDTLASTDRPIEMRVTLTTNYGESYSFEFFFNVVIEG